VRTTRQTAEACVWRALHQNESKAGVGISSDLGASRLFATSSQPRARHAPRTHIKEAGHSTLRKSWPVRKEQPPVQAVKFGQHLIAVAHSTITLGLKSTLSADDR